MEVFRWLREGGVQEDSPLCRSARHFHDPLKDWAQAGLSMNNPLIAARCGAWSFPSSLIWSQTDPQDPRGRLGGTWSWQEARRRYAEALTNPDPGTRDRAWADTLRALGQAMHLVTDASVPEHVRNDVHVLEAMLRTVRLRGYGSYEYWVSDLHGGQDGEGAFISRYLEHAIAPDQAVLAEGTGNASIRIPIARLIDTDRYTGDDPNVTLSGPIGLAEFANANFFSEDTWKRQYRFPDVDRLVPSQNIAPSLSYIRAYFDKAAGEPGLPVSPVLAECVFEQPARDAGIPATTIVKCTDPNVWARVAETMLPRAVGYSTALLDYFFRGRLEVQAQLAFGPSGLAPGIRIINRTPGETMDGTFELLYDKTAGARASLATWQLTLPPDDANASGVLVIPTAPEAEELGRYLLVFRGTLGGELASESQAVAATWFDLVLFFSMEKDIANGQVTLDTSFAAPAPVPVDYPVVLGAGASHQKDPYGPRYPGEGERFVMYALYRGPAAVPGNTAVVTYSLSQCVQSILTSLDPFQYMTNVTDATAQIVEFALPASIEELYQYHWPGPQVARVLAEFSGEGGGFAVDITDVRFLGVVSTAQVPPGGGFGYQNSCGGGAVIEFRD